MNIDHCTSLTSLSNYLKEQASRPDLKQSECKLLYSALEERCQRHYMNRLMSTYRNWYICDGVDAACTYLYRNWRFQKSINANRDYLFKIAEHIQKDFFCADGPQLTMQEATHILSVIDECYGFSKRR